jgi:uncharacterized protein YndB with AHSA1/START domain
VPADELVFETTRAFPVPRARLYEFFADAALLAKWWGPRGFTIPGITFAPRVGAGYRIKMQPPRDDLFELTGTFRMVKAPSRLAFSFEWVPADPEDQETLAELWFEVIDDSTEVRLRQGPFKTEARRALHQHGWTESLARLAELIAEER